MPGLALIHQEKWERGGEMEHPYNYNVLGNSLCVRVLLDVVTVCMYVC